jgi:hypothetical protein
MAQQLLINIYWFTRIFTKHDVVRNVPENHAKQAQDCSAHNNSHDVSNLGPFRTVGAPNSCADIPWPNPASPPNEDAPTVMKPLCVVERMPCHMLELRQTSRTVENWSLDTPVVSSLSVLGTERRICPICIFTRSLKVFLCDVCLVEACCHSFVAL